MLGRAPTPRKLRRSGIERVVRVVSALHRAWIRKQPCACCGQSGTDTDPIQAAHVRMGMAGGMALKPGDHKLVPLRYSCHTRQHMVGESVFWRGKDPVALAMNYARRSPDVRIKEAAR